MDFDLIDGLSDEEVQSLYSDAIVDGVTDGVHTGSCDCRTSSGYVFFGDSAYGGCELLQSQGLYSQYACTRWCTRHGFSLTGFYPPCVCLRYSEVNGTYGWIGRCGT